MTLQAYQVAIADLRHWHEGDRFQRHFDDIEVHVNALGTLTEVKSLPAPSSILLTRNAEGRLCNPTTGEPFTIVIDTIDGRKEVTSIWFAGERDVPIKLPDPVYMDSEQPADAGTLNAVSVMENEDAMRAHLASLIEGNFHTGVVDLISTADPALLGKVIPMYAELRESGVLNHGLDADIFNVVKAYFESPLATVQGVGDMPTATDMEQQTIDGIPVFHGDLMKVDPNNPPITLGTLGELGANTLGNQGDSAWVDDEEDEPAEPPPAAAENDAPSTPPRKPKSRKKAGR